MRSQRFNFGTSNQKKFYENIKSTKKTINIDRGRYTGHDYYEPEGLQPINANHSRQSNG